MKIIIISFMFCTITYADEILSTNIVRAAAKNDLESLELYISGNKLNEITYDKQPVMFWIIKWNYIGKSTIEYLLSNGFDVNVTNKGGTDLLKSLIYHKDDAELANIFIKHGLVPKDIDLLYSTCFNRTEIFKLLLEYKLNPNITDMNGNTTLMNASSMQNIEMMQELIKRKVNINATNAFGMNALMQAASYQWDTRGIDLLITNGANVMAVDRYGKGVLSYARVPFSITTPKERIDNMVKILKKYGAK